MRVVLVFLLTTTLLAICFQAKALSIYRTGNPNDIVTRTQQVNCLAGGGDDNLWVGGWKYMLNSAAGGDIVIIRTDGEAGGYASWIYDDSENQGLPRVNSVTVLSLVGRQDANDPRVVKALGHAELIFFSGGDQSTYISWFHKTALESELYRAIRQRNVPVGGTSAGMALLAGIDFRARYPSPSTGGMVTSEDVLKNPTAKFVDLDSHVIIGPDMEGIITDTHFSQRNRHGRMIGFLAKALIGQNLAPEKLHGIGADQDSAFCYNKSGVGRVFGPGSVYFFSPQSRPEILKAGQPLTWSRKSGAVRVQALAQGEYLFDLKAWRPITQGRASPVTTAPTQEIWWVEQGQYFEGPL